MLPIFLFLNRVETADTLEALRLVNGMDLPTIALTNVPSSTMVREADGFLLTQAGQENRGCFNQSILHSTGSSVLVGSSNSA